MAPANIVDRAEEPASRKGLFIGLGVVALVGVIVAVVVVMSGPSGSGGKDGKSGQPKADAALVATLVRIDERMMAGEYTGPGGNTALDHLRAAVKAAPGDARVKERQQKLVLLFEQRADDAMKRGDLAEVAVQLTALSLADPSRPGVSERLADAESRVKNQHKK
jgi:hypothetical protein